MKIDDYEAIEKLRIKINVGHLERGVKFIDIRAAYIDESVNIGKGTTIYPCVVLEGKVRIGENCIIGQNTRIVDSTVGAGTEVHNSVILESRVGSNSKVGPFAYLRPHSDIGDNCKVGDFVEVKNSSMADGAKASHLTYIGDSDIGKNVNLGCGTVFVNYDGIKKYRSAVKAGAFIGCNANIISPVVIEEGAYVAAGSTVTKDVPAGALCIARAEERIIKGWSLKKGLVKKKQILK